MNLYTEKTCHLQAMFAGESWNFHLYPSLLSKDHPSLAAGGSALGIPKLSQVSIRKLSKNGLMAWMIVWIQSPSGKPPL